MGFLFIQRLFLVITVSEVIVNCGLQTLPAELALDFGIPLIEACKQPASESGIDYICYL